MISIDHFPPANAPRPRSVRRALDMIEADAGRRWRVSELAEAAGVSGRTLQRQFMKFLGASPLAVQQELALERARQEILKAAPAEKVGELARRCGFAHLGRFSADYRRRYGEPPSSYSTVDLKMTLGSVYEVVVLQAERWCCGSNYMLTLANFIGGKSQCVSTCGDGVVAGDEECDCGTDASHVPAG